MALGDEIKYQIKNTFGTKWDVRQGNVVPDTESISLKNGAVQFDGTVLYADLAQSSILVDEFRRKTAAKVIKQFLFCCTRIINLHKGKITSFDGDRIMGIFIGDYKNTNATIAALKIHYTIEELLKPQVQQYFISYKKSPYEINHAVGIDRSDITAIRAGQRKSNDLIWIGRAPNLAAKLSETREKNYRTYITDSVYNKLDKPAKYGADDRNMWEERSYKWLGKELKIYSSHWYWPI